LLFVKRDNVTIRYFIESGDEAQCVAQLEQLCDTVAEFEGIQLVVTLVLETIVDVDLGDALKLLRNRAGMVILLCVEKGFVLLLLFICLYTGSFNNVTINKIAKRSGCWIKQVGLIHSF
jgi:hypothetical protein